MDDFGRFCGFFLAHGVWSLEPDGTQPIVPMLALGHDGQRSLQRFSADRYEDAVAQAQAAMAAADDSAEYRAVMLDGYMPAEGGRVDSVILAGTGGSGGSVRIFVPYWPGRTARLTRRRSPLRIGSPAVHWDGDQQAFGAGLTAGITEHEQAAAFWSEHTALQPAAG